MPLPDIFSAIVLAAMGSLIQGIAIGTVLVVAVSIFLRSAGYLNGATRALVWLATLVALPVIPVLCWMNHATAPVKPSEPVALQPVVARSPLQQALPVRPAGLHTPAPALPHAPGPRLDLSVSRDAPLAALGVYCGIVFLLSIRLLAAYARICLLRRRARPAPSEVHARLSHWLARCPTDRNVELVLCDKLRSPVAIGFRRPMIVMPAALVLELNEQEFDDLGVHELAHIRRYDDWTNLLQQILQAILFFHPAVYWVGRKLRFECEVACDDWVVSQHGAKSYARCLTKLVEMRSWQRAALLSSGAFFSKGQILRRVELLLDKTRNSAAGVSGVTGVAILLALAGFTMQVARLPAFVSVTQEHGGSYVNGQWKDGERDLRVRLRGEMTLSPDERSIVSLSPWGYVEMEESKGWTRRRIEVRPSPSGEPEQKYFVNGRERPIDEAGREWAAATYPFLMRQLGLDVDGRVRRILSLRGAKGVLDEVNLIHSDHTKGQYLTQLFAQATLSPDDLHRAAMCVRRISSDNDKAAFLLANVDRFTGDDARREYFRALDSIRSDYDRRRVLVGVLEADGRSPGTAELVGRSAESIHSDNDKATVLMANPAGTTQCSLLRAATTIRSDFDKARVLRDASYLEASQCSEEFFEVVNLIHSDNDRSNVLKALLERPGLDAAVYERIARAARPMASDNDKANVLVLLGGNYAEAPFFDAVNTIHSDNDRKRVLKKVVEGGPAKTVLLNAIESASLMSSDNDKAEILVAAAKASTDANVRSALQRACGKIHSDNEYRRVASALFSEPAESQ